MSDILLLVGGDAPDAPMVWAQVSENGAVRAHGQLRLGERAPAAAPARTVLILPGAEARLKALELPARTEAQARAGARLLFEGALADDEDMHWAVGAAQDGAGRRLAAAISAPRLRDWLARCRAMGAAPALAALDCTLWPVAPGEISIAVTADQAIVAGGLWGGFSIEADLAPAVFARWLAETGAQPARIVLHGGEAAAWRNALGAHAARLEIGAPPDAIAALARGALAAPATAPNLLQGDFAPESGKAAPLKLWRFAALLAAAALLLQVGSQLIAGVRDQRDAAQITAAAEKEFRALHPGRIVNLRAQVTALANQAAQSGRHPVLITAEPVAAALRQHPLARIDEVRHQAPSRTVRLIVSASDQASLEAVIAAMRAGGLALDRRDTPPREGRYAAELSVEASP